MSLTTPTGSPGFRHEAMFYEGIDEFVDLAVEFVSEGLDAGDLMLVATSAPKIDAVRSELGPQACAIAFADMAEIGANPSRIIPRWQVLADEGRRLRRAVRGMGEPVWPDRTPAEMAECHRHEALLNVAFGGGPDPFWLVCPYDVAGLSSDVVEAARTTHPATVRGGTRQLETHAMTFSLGEPLPPPPPDHVRIDFDAALLPRVRQIVATAAERGHLDDQRAADLVLAADELAANSVLHGGGRGTLRVWHDDPELIVEVADRGTITDPLAGRVAPSPEAATGRGLWIVNQLCDLVQLRSDASQTVVRVHMRPAGRPAMSPPGS